MATGRGGRGESRPVRVDGLKKSFAVRRGWKALLRHPLRRPDRRVAVNGVSFAVGRGEFFGLLGPNGAGKTTLLKMLATLVRPDEGRAWIAGHEVRERPARVRRALVPVLGDERSLFWRLTADENLRLFAALYGLDDHTSRRRREELLEAVGLADAGRKMAGAFSSGMKQRLLIARALLAEPEVLLLDEPTRSLDPLAARAFRRFLRREVAGRRGCSVVLATHDAEEAFELCDRIAIMDGGKLLAEGEAGRLAEAHGRPVYRLWIRRPEDGSAEAALATAGVRDARLVALRPGGWMEMEAEVPDEDAAAKILAVLTRRAEVGRFERRPTSLADLLDSVIGADRASDDIRTRRRDVA